jgi:hypothetical protein
VSSVVVRHAGAGGENAAWNTRDFAIQLSNNGSTWSTAATVVGNVANVTTNVVNASARYVRLLVTTPTSNGNTAARVYEVQAMGPVPSLPGVNLALNRPTRASPSCNSNETGVKAVNGSWTGGKSDRWCSAAATKWLRVDLGSVRSVSGVVVRHAGAGGLRPALNTRDFTIEVSDDATTWTTVTTVTGNTANVTTHPLTASGRYVRLSVTAPTSDPDTYARIYEFEVMAPEA